MMIHHHEMTKSANLSQSGSPLSSPESLYGHQAAHSRSLTVNVVIAGVRDRVKSARKITSCETYTAYRPPSPSTYYSTPLDGQLAIVPHSLLLLCLMMVIK